jgi:enoyl-CoA hydratase/carnithine racemase
MSLGPYEHLEVVTEGPVVRLTLNRPDCLNALNDRIISELLDFFGALFWRHDLRVVILTGAGPGFCAGLDIKNNSGRLVASPSRILFRQRRISEIIIAMRRCPQVIVALVNGAASGGGFGMVLASDIRIAVPTARMNAAFIRLGLSACDVGVSYFLPRMVGSAVAAQYMLTGRFIDAAKALSLGLLSQVVEPDGLQTGAQALIDDLLYASPLGLRLTKDALNFAIDAQGLEAVIQMEDRNQTLAAVGEDFPEGIAAFREKRRPRYGK